MKTIVLLGKRGQLGFELEKKLSHLGRLIALSRDELDVTQLETLATMLEELHPDIIVNATAYTAVDKAQSDEIACFHANVSAPAVMARVAHKLNALLVHYSTDYVFDGTKQEPYIETDMPNPINYYGYTKLLGEEAIKHSGCAHLIFRTSWVYHPEYGTNFFRTMLRLAKERETLNIVADQKGVPNDATWLAFETARILSHPLHDIKQKSGIYHLTQESVMTWFDFAKSIIETLPNEEKKCHTINPIPTEAYPTPAQRPKYSVLCADKLKMHFGN